MLLDLLGEGLTNKQIAARMFLAEKTVKNYVSRLLAKLGMERRTQAAVFVSKLDQSHRQPGGVKRLDRQDGRATITGMRADSATAELTEPSSIPAKPPRPWLPTTVNCADSDCSSS